MSPMRTVPVDIAESSTADQIVFAWPAKLFAHLCSGLLKTACGAHVPQGFQFFRFMPNILIVLRSDLQRSIIELLADRLTRCVALTDLCKALPVPPAQCR